MNVPMLKEDELVGVIGIYRQRGPAVHRQADRAGAELRRPGRHRHREHAAAQRIAAIAGAADRDVGRARVISSSPGELEPVFQAMLENATRICEAKFGRCISARAMLSVPSPCTARRRPTPKRGCAELVQPGPDTGIGRVVATQTRRADRRCFRGPRLFAGRSHARLRRSSLAGSAPCSACRCSRTTK